MQTAKKGQPATLVADSGHLPKSRSPFRRIRRLSVRIFLLILLCVILPMYGILLYLRYGFEQYMQEELSSQVIQSISKSEGEIYGALKSMAGISSVMASNRNLALSLQSTDLSYYQKMLAFDDTVASITANNLFGMEDVRITLFDTENRVYSNWSTNYDNYDFLLRQEWVQASIAGQGHIIWNMFSPGYIISEGGREQTYISLARSMLSDGVTGERIGTIIISIGQERLRDILAKYAYNATDRIYVCVDDGEILLRLDNAAAGTQEQVREAFARMEGPSGSMLAMLDGCNCLVSYYTLSSPWTFNNERLRVLHYTEYEAITRQVAAYSRQAMTVMLLFLAVITGLAGMLSVRIVRPVRLLDQQMRDYTVGMQVSGLDIGRRDEIGSLNHAFVVMSGYITELFQRLAKEHEVREKYRFESLRAQLNPHFLFNTLGSIRWMAMIRGADNMVQSIDALSGMLRYTMNRDGELATLAEELQSVRDYVFIQNTRYGDRYRLEVDIPPALLEQRVVKFILQPIVENAILHGLKEMGRNGVIRIWAEQEQERLFLYVEDNGKGIPPDVLETLNHPQGNGGRRMTGIGFSNVHERLRTVYGEPFGLAVESRPNSFTTVIYTLPLLEGELPEKEGADGDPCDDCG